MDPSILTGIFTLLGAIIGGLITFFLQKQRFNQELKILQENYKTEFVAETTIKKFLNDPRFTDRTFATIKKHLGGFDDEELRKLMVRSGAIRIFKGEEEYWRLIDAKDA
ncbi:hypothetical protein [Salinimicrobium sp. HB62]|uniref:hypothetical protein n=1 Tax=Salinimicrobium sp. HB62 TaxID=3077781 RepID=UPI002D7A1F89|nr:hypothetical protein [Salinimicrobium sp. HB62]